MATDEMTDDDFFELLSGVSGVLAKGLSPCPATPVATVPDPFSKGELIRVMLESKPLTTVWHSLQPGIQRRRRAGGGVVHRVRFKRRTYPVSSYEEGCDLLQLLRKHRGNTSGYSSPRKTIELT